MTDKVGAQSDSLLVEAVRANKYVRWIGDNLQFPHGVQDERKDHHKHLVHMFSSALLVSDRWFDDLDDTPEIPLHDLTVEDLLLTKEEHAAIRIDCVKLVGDVLAEYLDQFKIYFKKFAKDSRKAW